MVVATDAVAGIRGFLSRSTMLESITGCIVFTKNGECTHTQSEMDVTVHPTTENAETAECLK